MIGQRMGGFLAFRPKTTENVIWTAGYGVAVAGNTITKNIATADWDAGAISTQTIATDGYVEFGALADSRIVCGLSYGDTDYGYADIDFGMMLEIPAFGGPAIQVWQNGPLVQVGTAWSANDRFRVQVVSGVVTYWHKPSGGSWTLLYTSLVAPTFPLLVDTSIYSEGGAITDVVIRRLW